VRFSAQHRFPGPPDVVAAILGDPAFYRTLRLPDLTLVGVDEERPSDGVDRVRVLVRYEFSGELDAVARRLLGGARPAWTQELRLRGGGGAISFTADANPRLLHGRADFTLDELEPDTEAAPRPPGTLRRLEGQLTVAVPGIGGMAERRIVPGILRRLDVEAAAVRDALS
jgi:hypothetical protein